MGILIPKSGVLRSAGQTIITDPSAAKEVTQRDTLQCVHCQHHWQVIPGSGRERGFCRNCMGPVCGAKACVERCMPWEKQADIREKEHRMLIKPEDF